MHLGQDAQRLAPRTGGRRQLPGAMLDIAEPGQADALPGPVTGLPVARHGLLVAGDGVGRAAQLAVRQPEALPAIARDVAVRLGAQRQRPLIEIGRASCRERVSVVV